MKVGDRHFRTIWLNEDGRSVDIIDQRWLPHELRIVPLRTARMCRPPSATCGCAARR
jgi:methylthioribose-1-phosphate isomerase